MIAAHGSILAQAVAQFDESKHTHTRLQTVIHTHSQSFTQIHMQEFFFLLLAHSFALLAVMGTQKWIPI